MIDILQTANEVVNYNLNSKITDNYQENFIRLLWNSYNSFEYSLNSPVDLKKCKKFLSDLNLEHFYNITRNLNVYVTNAPTLQIYYLSGSSVLSHSVMVKTQKFDLTDFKDYIRKNTNDTFFLYQISKGSITTTEYYIRYNQIKMDYLTLLSLPKSNRRLLWERKLKLEKLVKYEN